MLELHVCKQITGDLIRKFALGDMSEYLIGRDSDCDIRIRNPSISREHCIIEQDENGAMLLRDADSTCGTFVEGKKIDAVRIEDGLEVVIGPAVLKFYDAEI
jgi:pSer/pThr/pTyr-binding forkhead associated (FHA) protein